MYVVLRKRIKPNDFKVSQDSYIKYKIIHFSINVVLSITVIHVAS